MKRRRAARGSSAALTVALLSGAAAADNGAVVTAAVAGSAASAGAAASQVTPAAPPQEIIGRELSDWVDPRTLSTSVLRSGCGHVVELRLSGTGARNFLSVTVSNESGEPAWLDGNAAMARLGDGPSRRLEVYSGSEEPLPQGFWKRTLLAFPSKEEFHGVEHLSVELPFRWQGDACTLHAELSRPRGVAPVPETDTLHGRLEVYLGGGARFAASDTLAKLGAAHTGGAVLGGAGYFGVHHGIFFDSVIDGYGSSGVSAAARGMNLRGEGNITAVGFFPGYVFRVVPYSWMTLAYYVGVSPYIFELSDENEKNGAELTKAVFSLRHRLRVAAPFYRLHDGSGFALGASVVHTYVPYGSLGSASLEGHTVGWLAEFVIDG